VNEVLFSFLYRSFTIVYSPFTTIIKFYFSRFTLFLQYEYSRYIIAAKKNEVEQKKELMPVEELKTFPLYNSMCNSLVSNLLTEGPQVLLRSLRESHLQKV
jgi:hypothetical protein